MHTFIFHSFKSCFPNKKSTIFKNIRFERQSQPLTIITIYCLILTTSRSWDRRMPSLTVSWTVLFPVGLISLLYFSLSKNSWSFFSAGSWPRVPNPRTITKALATKNHFESILKSILLQAFLERHSLACLTLAYIPVRLIRLPGESICTATVYSFQQ